MHGLGGGVGGVGGPRIIGNERDSKHFQVWVVLWGARAGPESLDVHRLPCISIVWAVVLGGAGGTRIIVNAKKKFMHFNALSLYRTAVWGARWAAESLEA